MELYGSKLCLDTLLRDVSISKFVSDRHIGISSFIQKNHPEIIHRYDIRHVAKSMFNSFLCIIALQTFSKSVFFFVFYYSQLPSIISTIANLTIINTIANFIIFYF